MFLKKSVVLSCESSLGKRPVVAKIEYNGINFAVEIKNFIGVVAASFNGEIYCEEISNGKCIFNTDGIDEFCLTIYDGNEFYSYCNGENLYKKEDIFYVLKDYKKEEKEPIAEYDDFAIAEENYFKKELVNKEKQSIICEKEDFLFCNEKNKSVFEIENKDKNEDKNNDKSNVFEEKTVNGNFEEGSSEEKRKENGDGENEICSSYCTDNDQGKQLIFYEKIAAKLEELFVVFPEVKELEEAVDSSVFVKINYAEDKFYVVGVTKLKGKPEYIMFGIPAKKEENARIFSEKAYYIPCRNDSGYFLIYQDAISGKILSPI